MTTLLCLALAAAPLPGSELLAQSGLSNARVGDWATFELVGSDRPYFWRLAAVAEDTDASGRPAVWLELEFGSHPALRAPMAQIKLRVARGFALDARGVSRAFVAFGADRPREIEPGQVPALFHPGKRSGFTGADVHVVHRPAMAFMTARGSITASPVEIRFRQTVVKRFWLSDAVPLLGLARLELPAIGYTLEARDWGQGARPQMPTVDLAAARIRMEGYDAAALP